MQTREHPKQCVSARIITWRVQASTIRFVQSYATIADVDKRETDYCSEMLQEVVKRIPGRLQDYNGRLESDGGQLQKYSSI